MKTMLLGMALATFVGGAVGCAHEVTDAGAAQDRYGALRVARETRLLLAGPASGVHTNFDPDKPVWLFVVGAVHGDDRDCALQTVREPPIGVEARRPLHIDKGRELCVAVAGTAEVLWHARVDTRATAPTTTVEPRAVALQ